MVVQDVRYVCVRWRLVKTRRTDLNGVDCQGFVVATFGYSASVAFLK